MALLISIALFSTIEVASKLMQSGGAVAGRYPFWLAWFRFFVAGLVLLIPAIHQLRSRSVGLTRRDVAVLGGLGLLGVTLMSSLYHLSITFLPANVAALVFSCNPVFVVLFAPVVLSEKMTSRKLTAVAVCLCGIWVLARDRADGISVVGLLLMLAAIVVFALYTVLLKKVTPRYGALSVTGFVALAGGVFLLPLAWAAEGMPLATYAAVDWLGMVYLAVVGTALAYFLFIYGMNHVEAGSGSMIFFLKPFLAALFAGWVLDETLSAREFVAAAIILVGMVIALVPFRLVLHINSRS